MPTRIQTDRGRGINRRFGIRGARQELNELDSRVYPVTIAEPHFGELASLRHQGVNAGTALGTAWDSFAVAGPVGAGTVLGSIVLSRGLYTVGGRVDVALGGAGQTLFTLEHVSAAGVAIGECQFLGGCSSVTANIPALLLDIPMWNDQAGSTLRIVAVEAPNAGSRVAGFLWAARHYSDVQDGSE